jgi:hypothetical protein
MDKRSIVHGIMLQSAFSIPCTVDHVKISTQALSKRAKDVLYAPNEWLAPTRLERIMHTHDIYG